jgi:hypothetical protein
MKFEEKPEWIMGDTAQKRWAQIVARSGKVVLPTYGMKDVAASSKAPLLFTRNGLRVAPDMLLMQVVDGKSISRWHEVKAKGKPTWRRCHPGPRWEHGIDFALLKEYLQVQLETGAGVWLVVFEENSPRDAAIESPLDGPAQWLAITLNDAHRVGDLRIDWPGGKFNPRRRGKRGEGGWLWDRADMTLCCNRKDTP